MDLKGPGHVHPGRHRRVQRGLGRLVPAPGSGSTDMTTGDPRRSRRGSARGLRSRRRARGWDGPSRSCPGLLMLAFLFLIPMVIMFVFSFWRTNSDFDVVRRLEPQQLRPVLQPAGLPADVRQDPGHGDRCDRGGPGHRPAVHLLPRPLREPRAGSASSCSRSSSRSGRATCSGSTPGRRSWARPGALNQFLMGIGLIQEPSTLLVYNDLGGLRRARSTSTSRSRRWPSTRPSRSSTSPSSTRPRTWGRGRTRRSGTSCCRRSGPGSSPPASSCSSRSSASSSPRPWSAVPRGTSSRT